MNPQERSPRLPFYQYFALEEQKSLDLSKDREVTSNVERAFVGRHL